MKLKTSLVIVISLLNLVAFRIYNKSIFYFILLFIQSISLFLLFEKGKTQRSKEVAFRFLAVVMLVLPAVAYLRADGLTGIVKPTYLELDTIAARREYYAEELGVIYRNRIGILFFDRLKFTLSRFTRNAFSCLDFNLFIRYSNILDYLFLVCLVVGLYALFIGRISKTILIYFLAIFVVGGLLNSGSTYGFYLYLPLVNFIISLGFLKIIKL